MQKVVNENILQLTQFLKKISKEDYQKKMEVLSGSSIGQHIRHVLEFYQMIIDASSLGCINYDKRNRDKSIEESPLNAIRVLESFQVKLANLNETKDLVFEADFTQNGSPEHQISTSLGREMAYCLEHSIHHQAIIKAGLVVMNLKHLVDHNFGVAYSTLRHKNKVCAQ